jgi:hypothetical protein
MSNIKLFSGILVFMFCVTGYAQFENKMTLSVFTGLPIYESADGNNPTKNLFNAYDPIPYLGVGVGYAFNTKLSSEVNLKYLYSSKANYTISNVNFGLGFKYNFVHNDKPVSPFIYIEGNLSYMYLEQQEADGSFVIESTESSSEDVDYNTFEKSYPLIKVGMFPVMGYMVGAGVDFNIKQKYGLFISANYMATNAHQHASIEKFFPQNDSKFNFILIKAGVKFAFLKNKTL